MGQFAVPSHIRFLKGGGTITYKGTASVAVWWKLVGWNGTSEIAPYGSIVNAAKVADVDGLVTAHYNAPTVHPGAGKYDRLYVYEEFVSDEVAMYLDLGDDYNTLQFDPTQQKLWCGPAYPSPDYTSKYWSINLTTGAFILDESHPTGDTGWGTYTHRDVAPDNGRLYVSDSTTNPDRIHALSGTDLSTVATSAGIGSAGTGILGLWVRGGNVYVYTQLGATRELSKLPLSLASITWTVNTTDALTGGEHRCIMNAAGTYLWFCAGKKLKRFTISDGTVTTYDLTGSLGSYNSISAIGYDGSDAILLWCHGGSGFGDASALVAYSIAGNSLGAFFTSPVTNASGGFGGHLRTSPDYVYLKRYDNAKIIKFQISTMTIVEEYAYDTVWGITGNDLLELNAAITEGVIYDGVTTTLWLVNTWAGTYSTRPYGIWRLPL